MIFINTRYEKCNIGELKTPYYNSEVHFVRFRTFEKRPRRGGVVKRSSIVFSIPLFDFSFSLFPSILILHHFYVHSTETSRDFHIICVDCIEDEHEGSENLKCFI